MLLTVRARRDAEALIRASRVLGVDPTGAELIKDAAAEAASSEMTSSTHRSYPPSNSVASVSSDALLDTFDVPELEPSLASNGRRGFAEIPGHSEDALKLDVSEADIARMFPRVVSHRVRVRDSPFDEVLSSAMGGPMSTPTDADGRELLWERSTVKDILVRILSEV